MRVKVKSCSMCSIMQSPRWSGWVWMGLLSTVWCGAGWAQTPPASLPRRIQAVWRRDLTVSARGWLHHANVVVLQRWISRQILPSGAELIHLASVSKPLTDLGARALTQLPLVYSGDTRILAARAWVASPRRLWTPSPDAIHDFAMQLPLFTLESLDLRERQITLPNVQPGRLVIVDIHERLRKNSDFPGDATYLANRQLFPVAWQRIKILAPAGMRMRYELAPRWTGKAPSGMRLRFSQSRVPEGRKYRFLWTHIPAFHAEPYMNRRALPLVVTNFQNWRQVAAWYYHLAVASTQVTPAIRAAAQKITARHATRNGKIKALYSFVARKFRYLSLSFGVGRVRPHPATEVLTNGYGDCKDKAALLIALLRAAGIRADFFLLNTQNRLLAKAPSPRQFNHAIVAVPEAHGFEFLDATLPAEFGSLLGDAGHRGLLIQPQQGHLMRIPALEPRQLETRETDQIHFQANGNAKAICEIRYGPAPGLLARLALQLAGARTRAMEKALARAELKGVRLRRFTHSPFSDLNHRFTIHTLRSMDGQINFQTHPAELPLWWHMAPQDVPHSRRARHYGLNLNALVVPYRQTMRIQLPAEYAPVLPPDVNITTHFAQFHMRYAFDAATHILTVQGEQSWLRPRLAARRLDAYRLFDRRATRAEKSQLRLRRIYGGSPAESAAVQRKMWRELRHGRWERVLRLGRQLGPEAALPVPISENLARARLGLNENARALALLIPLAAKAPLDLQIQGLLAEAELRAHHLHRAWLANQRQLRLTPYNAGAEARAGRILAAQGQPVAALADFAQAVKIAPGTPEWRLELGQQQARMGKSAAAQASLIQAAALPQTTSRQQAAMAKITLRHHLNSHTALGWCNMAVLRLEAQLQKFHWSRLTWRQWQLTKELPAWIEMDARLRHISRRPRALALERLAVVLRPDHASWVMRLARWERQRHGAAAALPWDSLAATIPAVSAKALNLLMRDYSALPKHNLPVNLYLMRHPALRPRFGGLLVLSAAETDTVFNAWVRKGQILSVNASIRPSYFHKLQLLHFAAPILGSQPLNYSLGMQWTASGKWQIVPLRAPARSSKTR